MRSSSQKHCWVTRSRKARSWLTIRTAERQAATAAVVDAGHAKRVAFLMMVPEDLRMAVGIALSDPVRGEYLADWAC